MITKEAKQRLNILQFWQNHGLKATNDAFGAKYSTLYGWRKIYIDSDRKIESLNPGTQARRTNHRRKTHPLILKEIRRLRLEECPNMGKTKVKKNLDIFCKHNGLPICSESKPGRIIKEKKVYHHRQKIYHDGSIKIVNKRQKERKPKDFVVKEPGDLIAIDTIVKFIRNIKRYIITAIDIKTAYSFAYCYKDHGSDSAKYFFKKLEQAFPYGIKAVQTDNGSEFHKYFMGYLEKQKIIHYWNYKGQPAKMDILRDIIEPYRKSLQMEMKCGWRMRPNSTKG